MVLLALGAGCKEINIPGNLAGQILNQAGQGQGYLSVAAIDVETGVEAQRLTAEDGGNFFFEKLDAGRYIIKTFSMAGKELPNDCPEVSLGAGRTEQVIIYLIAEE
jgi:hypothetical protein